MKGYKVIRMYKSGNPLALAHAYLVNAQHYSLLRSKFQDPNMVR